MPNNKKVPNPDGKLGKEDHRNLIEEIFQKLSELFLSQKEFPIDVENNKKRYADVAKIDEKGNPTEIHQVGRTNKNGTPVSRERKAIEDIEKATGLKVIFHPLVILAIIGFTILYLIQN